MTDTKTQVQIVKESISDLIGVDAEDIEDSNILLEDLHMGATELTELLNILHNKGIGVDVDKMNFSQVHTVEDLLHELDVDI